MWILAEKYVTKTHRTDLKGALLTFGFGLKLKKQQQQQQNHFWSKKHIVPVTKAIQLTLHSFCWLNKLCNSTGNPLGESSQLML